MANSIYPQDLLVNEMKRLSPSNGSLVGSRWWRSRRLVMSFLAGLKKQAVTSAAVVLWLPAVAFGINVLWKYSTTPGQPGAPPLDWPPSAPIERVNGRATLVMFAHPQCECSKATLGELAIIMAHAPGRLEADVFFYLPASAAGTWARTDLWQSASAIPGVRGHEDREAAVAPSFGPFPSGPTLLSVPRQHPPS